MECSVVNKSDYLVIVPARGGSKRLPRKNLLPLAGKPLLNWTIEAAIKSKIGSNVVVSTDDEEIKAIAKAAGADVPFIRSKELAGDAVTTFDVVKDVIERVGEPANVILLQPTSPLRTEHHINEAVALFREKQANAVVSVCQNDHPIEWSNTLPDDGNMDHFITENIRNLRSQDLPVTYRLNGAIYITKTKVLLEECSFFAREKSFAFLMQRDVSVDIDEMIDFELAKLILKVRDK